MLPGVHCRYSREIGETATWISQQFEVEQTDNGDCKSPKSVSTFFPEIRAFLRSITPTALVTKSTSPG